MYVLKSNYTMYIPFYDKLFMSACVFVFRDADFSMFDSMLDHKDLIFQDSTVRLVPVKQENQNYQSFLGARFVRAMDRMETIDSVTAAGATAVTYSYTSVLLGILSCLLIALRG